jgi:hypothetical protein
MTCISWLAIALSLLSLACSTRHGNSSHTPLSYLGTQQYYTDTELSDTSAPRSNWDGPLKYISGKDTLIYQHKKILVDDDSLYLVEGDLLLTEQEYFHYRFFGSIYRSDKRVEDFEKMWGRSDEKGNLIRWPKNTPIVYAVLKNTFPDAAEYEMVKTYMRQAARDWEGLCNVKIIHLDSRDGQTEAMPTQGLTCVVKGWRSAEKIEASSFHPLTAASKRIIRINRPRYFSTDYDKTGLLRHEIGHILGFIHEQNHKNAPRICGPEILSGTYTLTPYDKQSVMHYYCGGAGTKTLGFSRSDSLGAVEAFGTPLQ